MSRDLIDLDALSRGTDAVVLEGLEGLVRAGRRVTAELVAHLAEVEHRRLHLHAGFASLFSYCVVRHGMSEDEACRRIEAARLARKFPSMLVMLSSGELTLSVASLLKPYLCDDNSGELLRAVAGKSVRSAREALAARFPSPDVPSRLRKLPERRPHDELAAVARNLEQSAAAWCHVDPSAARPGPVEPTAAARRHQDPSASRPGRWEPRAAVSYPVQRSPARRPRVEPSSAGRYRVEFTAGASLKEKLELARDWMRHRNPDGDFAVIFEGALDLLLAKLERERFAKAARPREGRSGSGRADRVTAGARRQVVARDGQCCSFVGRDGRRCASRAFLEFDHRRPRGKCGRSEPENLRLYCRAHNRLAAELVYGRAKIEAAIAADTGDRARDSPREMAMTNQPTDHRRH